MGFFIEDKKNLGAFEGLQSYFTEARVIGYDDNGAPQFGVFATKFLATGEVIMACPCIITEAIPEFAGTELERYFFDATTDANYPELAIVLGNGSLINHSTNPNVSYEIDVDNRICKFFAIKPINIGEELTHDYGYDLNELDA